MTSTIEPVKGVSEEKHSTGTQQVKNMTTVNMITFATREYFLVLDKAMEALEEYGEYHEDGCLCMREDPDGCDCQMNGLKLIISKFIDEAYKLGKTENIIIG